MKSLKLILKCPAFIASFMSLLNLCSTMHSPLLPILDFRVGGEVAGGRERGREG